MNWDDLRFVLAVSRAGSLLGAARELRVDHTTVGRRVESAEADLGVRLFTRTTTGYVPTADAERLLESMTRVEDAVLAVERGARAQQGALEGTVRLTSPETFGTHYLAPRLAAFRKTHPGLNIELLPAGEVLDLGRQEAEVGVRTFRSRADDLAIRRAATVRYGFYAAPRYLRRRPLRGPAELAEHAILSIPPRFDEVEQRWLARLCPGITPAIVSPVSSALLEAARAGAGVAILPCYLGEPARGLRHVPMPDPPSEALWLTVHRDLRKTPRVRALLDFLSSTMEADAALLGGAR